MKKMESTYEVKLNTNDEQNRLLFEIAKLYGQAEHRIFTEMYVRGRKLNEVKSWSICELGLTARQFNCV